MARSPVTPDRAAVELRATIDRAVGWG